MSRWNKEPLFLPKIVRLWFRNGSVVSTKQAKAATSKRSPSSSQLTVGSAVRGALPILAARSTYMLLTDLLCFSWELRTLAGQDKIVSYLTERAVENSTTPHKTRFSHSSLSNVKLQADSGIGPPTMITIPRGKTEQQGIMACFTFSLANPERTGRGLVRLVKEEESEDWKAATIFFTVEDIVGHEEDVKERPEGFWDNHAKPWEEVKAEKIQSVEDDPTVLIGA